MKVAVTGASGFIGRHVLEQLVKLPYGVVAITRGNQSKFSELPDVRVVNQDINDASPNTFEDIGSPDVLIHLAWGGLPDYKSIHHLEHELPMHFQFLRLLVEAGLRSVFVAGTCFEYGMQSGPLDETMETLPGNPYGLAKDKLRRQLESLKKVHPFSLTWGRLFYVYGTGQSEKALLPQLEKAVEQGDKVFNMSGGKQLRDYIPVSTAAEYITSLALKKSDFGVVNICSGTPISVQELVENRVKERDYPIELNLGHYPYPDYEPMSFWGDRCKLDRCLQSS